MRRGRGMVQLSLVLTRPADPPAPDNSPPTEPDNYALKPPVRLDSARRRAAASLGRDLLGVVLILVLTVAIFAGTWAFEIHRLGAQTSLCTAQRKALTRMAAWLNRPGVPACPAGGQYFWDGQVRCSVHLEDYPTWYSSDYG